MLTRMNEDELRAFLESATVGDDASEPEESDGSEGNAAEADRPELAPTEPIVILPSAPQAAGPRPGRAARAGAEPSFDEIMGGNAEVTPLVLPGPPVAAPMFPQTSPSETAPPAAAPTAAAPTPRPAARQPAAAPQPPTAPLPQQSQARSQAPRTEALPDFAAELGFSQTPEAGYEPVSVTGGGQERRRVLPWAIVALVAVAAIIAAVFVVNAVRGGGDDTPPVAEPGGGGTGTSQPTPPAETPDEEEPSEPEAPETPGDEPPAVEVGGTFDMSIPQWDTVVDVSGKLGGDISYVLEGENLILQDGLLATFPASCSAMRTGFGMTRLADGGFEVLRPAESCVEAPELYDAVWGLVAAMVESARKA